ncbi:MAG: hypothetical protein ACLSH6_08470 [Limosilactobacillus pontis]
MSYQLVYLPQSGNKNYWTINNSFTHKDDQHRFWAQLAQLCADFPGLKEKFPTRFANKRDDPNFLHLYRRRAGGSATYLQLKNTETATIQSTTTPQPPTQLAITEGLPAILPVSGSVLL